MTAVGWFSKISHVEHAYVTGAQEEDKVPVHSLTDQPCLA